MEPELSALEEWPPVTVAQLTFAARADDYDICAWEKDGASWICVPVIAQRSSAVLAFPASAPLPETWQIGNAEVAQRDESDPEVATQETIAVQLTTYNKRRLTDLKLVSGGFAPRAEGFGFDEEMPHGLSLALVAQQWLQEMEDQRQASAEASQRPRAGRGAAAAQREQTAPHAAGRRRCRTSLR